MASAAPFDGLADDYDRSFTRTAIGERMRLATWRRIDRAFAPGDHVLELNCGTGEDALHLGRRGVRVLATDGSAAMVAIAGGKIERAGLSHRVELRQAAIEDLAAQRLDGPFDGILSNFGGLNCVVDLPALARQLAPMLHPGGRALLCVMGPAVPWEWGWFLARGQPRKALRRLSPTGATWRGLTINYPTIGRVRRAFAPDFVCRRAAAIGALLPPTFAEGWARRHPRLVARLDRWERRLEAVPPLPWLADHFLIEFERCPGR